MAACPLHAQRRLEWASALPGGESASRWAPAEWVRAAVDLSLAQQGGAAGRRATLRFWGAAWDAVDLGGDGELKHAGVLGRGEHLTRLAPDPDPSPEPSDQKPARSWSPSRSLQSPRAAL